MSYITTNAIVLSAIKYNDTSLIVRCLTEKEGVKSYIIKGVLKSKKGKFKPAYFQPLTQLQLTSNHLTKRRLHLLKEVRVINYYSSIYSSVIKQTIVLFLSEVLSNIIQEEEENLVLYSYVATALIWLDTHNDVSNFHLLFLLNLSKFLGFYPDVIAFSKTKFSLLEGNFTNSNYDKLAISGEKLLLFRSLLGINFDTMNTISYSKNERQTILQVIIQYFELHLEGFRKPKSLAVLETVFS